MLLLKFFVSFIWLLVPSHGGNNRPIIAVLASFAPIDVQHSYITASYVKFLEGAGARVVPIPPSTKLQKVRELFYYLNGAIFPGGARGNYEHAKLIFDLAITANDNGNHFPIWGTCLGFETLHVIAAGGDWNVLNTTFALDITLPLKFTEYALNSRMFGSIDAKLYKALQMENLTYNHHVRGVYPSTYKTMLDIKRFFKIVCTSYDIMNVEFVSSVEAFNYPIYGTAWHPEKNSYEFSIFQKLPHTKNAILIGQHFANFFIDETRKSNHHFPTPEMEDEYLIYHYKTFKTGGKFGRMMNFEEIYLFHEVFLLPKPN